MADGLRPPPPGDPTSGAYKEWLHLNLFDHATGAVGLVNVSLHGRPTDPRALAVGTVLLHQSDEGWLTHTEVRAASEANIGFSSLALRDVALAFDADAASVLASARSGDGRLSARLTARPRCDPVLVDRRIPLGSGWLSWYVIARLALEGTMAVGSRAVDLSRVSAYYDHNWGRWYWGDDMGWVWGAFVAPEGGPVFVLSWATDRSHRQGGPTLFVVLPGGRRRFSGPSLQVRMEGWTSTPLPRVPGAMAALHTDRARPRLPTAVVVQADDGVDRLFLELSVRSAAQVVTADPVRPGRGFIHELVGSFASRGSVEGVDVAAEGLAVFEYVD